jgi:Na+-translocating ferredoxin:NAD+ oxidoreductase subunit C
LRTFKIGGVHPEENKLSANKPIEILPVPQKVFIPVTQHLGAPSTLVVEKGSSVKVGTLLAKADAFICANVHSSVSGVVEKIEESIDTSGYRKSTIVINVEGDEWEPTINRSKEVIREISMTEKEIVERIKNMGVVGLGGATFPTHVKYMVPDGKKAKYLIINAVECEPYLTADHVVMLERAEETMIGIQIMMKALSAEKALIGIENNKPDAIAHMTKVAEKYMNIEVCALKVKYPQGAEKQLIKALTGREVPSGKLPIEVGCVVNNVGTALATYEAVQKNKPLVERVVTVTGKSVKNPCNLMVRIGTPSSALIEKAGGLPEDTGKVISGGPMMGKALNTLEVPVVKGTSGILIMNQKEAKRCESQSCIRCGKCVSVCPMGLEPYILQLLSEVRNFDEAEQYHIMDCIECGSCQYVCPSNRALLDYVRVGKSKVGANIRSRASHK